MKIAFELVPNLATHLSSHHQFSMWIENEGLELPNTKGGDSYSYNAMVLAEKPITATGRTAKHNIQPDITGLIGEIATAVDLEESHCSSMVLVIDNNLILSPGELQSFYSLRCYMGEQSFIVPLQSGVFPVSWEGLGRFNIKVNSLFQNKNQ